MPKGKLILILTVLNLVTCDQMLKKAKKIVKKEELCRSENIDFLFNRSTKMKDKGTYKPKKINKLQKSICPALDRTCCTDKDMKVLKEKIIGFRIQTESAVSLFEELDELLKSMELKREDYDKKEIKDAIYNKSNSFAYLVHSLEFFNEINEVCSFIVPGLRSILAQMEPIASGLSCQACSTEFTKMLSLETADGSPLLLYNYENFKEMAPIFYAIKEVAKKVEIIFTVYFLIAHMKGWQDTLINFTVLLTIQNSMNRNIKCLPLTIDEFQENEDCMIYIKQAGYFETYYYLPMLHMLAENLLVAFKGVKEEKEPENFIQHDFKSEMFSIFFPEQKGMKNFKSKFYLTYTLVRRAKDYSMSLSSSIVKTLQLIITMVIALLP